MRDIIQLLPDAIANQIAAGEVVQRPASVVKELLENAIDAEATQIQLIIKEAGKSLIQVIDDGLGMSPTDARMSFERHATSKIKKTEDLFNIRTMGFRGEALASIAAVAQVEMRTRRTQDEIGTLVEIEGSDITNVEDISCQKGTSIAVKNLFFNVPARRNFLKSNPVEMRHILDEFQRVALAHPQVTFSLTHNDDEVYQLSSGKLSHRIVSIFGKNYREQLLICEEETPLMRLKGYIGKPEAARKSRGEQFFFVNERFIRNSYMHHAVMRAFEGLLPKEAHPFYVLFIEIDPLHIDINVHPTKSEIKFDDERTVYAIINAAARKALGAHHVVPALDFASDVNFSPEKMDYRNLEKEKYGESGQNVQKSFQNYQKSPLEQSNTQHWDKLFEGFQKKAAKPLLPEENQEELFENNTQTLIFKSSLNANAAEDLQERETQHTTFQLHGRYIVTQVKSGLMIIDQHTAHQRVLYDKYLQIFRQKNTGSQQLLFPKEIQFSLGDYQLLESLQAPIRALNFDFEMQGQGTVLLRGVPAGIQTEEYQEMLEELIEQLKMHEEELSLEIYEQMAQSLARKTALKPGVRLSATEATTLVAQLFASSNPNYSPSGEPTLVIMDLVRLGEMFAG